MGKKNEAARMLANLNGPWSNAACMGYCLIAMRRANLRPGAQRRGESDYFRPKARAVWAR